MYYLVWMVLTVSMAELHAPGTSVKKRQTLERPALRARREDNTALVAVLFE